MKITKRGQLPEEQPFTGTCSSCKTEFECVRTDGLYEGDPRDGPHLKVKCPLCKREAYAYPS